MKIAILGAGNMGGWLIRELSPHHDIWGYDSDPARLDGFEGITAGSKLEDIANFGPQMLINAVNLKKTVETFKSAAPLLPRNAYLVDLASVKGELPRYYAGCGFRFVSIHPMFGPTFADPSRIRDENAILIRESDPEGTAFFLDFFHAKGLQIHNYTFEEHDRLIAYSLTLPFASTMVFAACMNSAAVPGTTFKKHLAIARGLLSEQNDLLTEILFNVHSVSQLDQVTSRLELLKHIIRERNEEEAAAFIERLRKNIGGGG